MKPKISFKTITKNTSLDYFLNEGVKRCRCGNVIASNNPITGDKCSYCFYNRREK